MYRALYSTVSHNNMTDYATARRSVLVFAFCCSSWCVNASWRVRRKPCSFCPRSWIRVSRRETSTSWWPTSWGSVTRDSRKSTGNLLWVAQSSKEMLCVHMHRICLLLVPSDAAVSAWWNMIIILDDFCCVTLFILQDGDPSLPPEKRNQVSCRCWFWGLSYCFAFIMLECNYYNLIDSSCSLPFCVDFENSKDDLRSNQIQDLMGKHRQTVICCL